MRGEHLVRSLNRCRGTLAVSLLLACVGTLRVRHDASTGSVIHLVVCALLHHVRSMVTLVSLEFAAQSNEQRRDVTPLLSTNTCACMHARFVVTGHGAPLLKGPHRHACESKQH